MALYQILTFVLPKKTVEAKYGEIPNQLEIKYAEREKYWGKTDVELDDASEPEFEDAISTNWWKGTNIDIAELRKDIDSIITRAKWNGGTSWKTENLEFDHDLSIDYNEKENYIEDFRFRTDLRDSTLTFLRSILDLCDRNGWILMDDKGILREPTLKGFAHLVKGSDAEGFLINPVEFFNSTK